MNTSVYNNQPKQKNSRRIQLAILIIIFIVLVVGGVLWYRQVRHTTLVTQAPLPAESAPKTTTQSSQQTTVSGAQTKTPEPVLDTSALTTAVNNAIAANPAITIGVSYIDLDTNTQLNFGQKTVFVAASTTKLVTAVDFLAQVEKGTYSINQMVNGTKATYQLQQLINQSNNNSWYAFIDLLSYKQIENYAHSIGLSSYDFTGDNLITPADEATLLKKLYLGSLLNADHTTTLLSYMQHTNEEDLIPAALPADATVYHKYGDIYDNYDQHVGGYLHDAAIILYNGHRIVLTVYTKNASSLNEFTQGAAIHDVTKAVIGYLK